MESRTTIKDEIIKFVLEATEEQNVNLATFIAGMQAQKQASKKNKELIQKQRLSKTQIATPVIA